MHHIVLYGTNVQILKFSQHELANALNNVNFSGQEYGLLRCTPPDILHVVEKGIVEQSIKLMLEKFTNSTKARLNNLAIVFNSHYQ